MPSRKLLLLVNPVSGRGRGGRDAAELQAEFARLGLETRMVTLTGRIDLVETIRTLAPDQGAAAAVGGDGTAASVAQALFAVRPDLPLGIIPWGNSNCLARHLGLPLDLKGAAGVIAKGAVKPLDLGLIGDRIFLSFFGAGLDAEIVERTARARRGTITDSAYVRAAADAIFKGPWPHLALEVDGRVQPGVFFQVIITPIVNYAHYFRAARGEGFVLFAFKGRSRASLFRTAARLGLGLDLEKAADLVLPVRESFLVRAVKGEVRYQYDGEAGGLAPVFGRIRPGGLKVLGPAKVLAEGSGFRSDP